jgi:hypothetical protein
MPDQIRLPWRLENPGAIALLPTHITSTHIDPPITLRALVAEGGVTGGVKLE